jgi:hypothetical protein
VSRRLPDAVIVRRSRRIGSKWPWVVELHTHRIEYLKFTAKCMRYHIVYVPRVLRRFVKEAEARAYARRQSYLLRDRK